MYKASPTPNDTASLNPYLNKELTAIENEFRSLGGIVGLPKTPARIASASTITPVDLVNFVTGTTTISNITPPSDFKTTGGYLMLIPTGIWSTNTSGNIALGSTAIVGKVMLMVYEAIS